MAQAYTRFPSTHGVCEEVRLFLHTSHQANAKTPGGKEV